MKHKGVYVLAITLLLAFTAGCGKNSETKNPQNEGTELTNQENTVTPEATATPEPTATPAPTATPKPANYMEEKGIEVLGAGRHGGKAYVATEFDRDGEAILEIGDCEYIFSVVKEEDEGNGGTKIIQVTLDMVPYVNETGGWSSIFYSGFVDLKTGKAYSPLADELQTVVLEQGDESHILQLRYEFEPPSVTSPYCTNRYTLVCPSDYEDAGFYVAGWDNSMDAYVDRIDCWKKLQFIRHGESDMLVFGVEKGLATEPEKKTVDGAELAEENYFEANGLTARGEGRITYMGTEGFDRLNSDTGVWEAVSVETKEVEIGFSVTEELLGDGTKQIKSSFSFEDEISETEWRGTCCKMGMADKRTGLVYPVRTYDLAEPYVIEMNGEQESILVGKEYIEKEAGSVTIVFSVICPENYDDTVFYITGNYERENYKYSNEAEVSSIRDIEHGESDLVFLR